MQLRDARGHVSRNSAGACTPVEDAVLAEMATDKRIVDLGSRSAFNYERASIIIYNMPLQDPELYGRLKDTVVKMAEALDIHMRSLDVVTSAAQRGDTLLQQLQHNAALARDISARLQAQRNENLRAMQYLAEHIKDTGAALAAPQQQHLQKLARDATASRMTTHLLLSVGASSLAEPLQLSYGSALATIDVTTGESSQFFELAPSETMDGSYR